MFIDYLRSTFGSDSSKAPTTLEKLIGVLIVLSVFQVVLETEPSIFNTHEKWFELFEIFFLSLFITEYFLRIIFCADDPKFSGISGRVKYIFTPYALIDAIAIFPSLLSLLSPEFMILRGVRLLRLLRITHLLRQNIYLAALMRAFYHAKAALIASLSVSIFVLFISAVLIYFAESEAQPEVFGSIPRAMWWAMATLTTVGYGDAYPITTIGKILASVVAILGIGVVAMPAGVIAAHFSKELDGVKK